MIGTKSGIGFIQYMPKKHKKFTIKVWVLCEALSGYYLQYQIYTGKAKSGTTEHGLSYTVVFDLLKNHLNRGFHIYLDNFYTNLSLVNDLVKQNTCSCGKVCSIDRGDFPTTFKKEKLNRDVSFIRNNSTDLLFIRKIGRMFVTCHLFMEVISMLSQQQIKSW